jgi:hypothetical protein
MAYNPSSAAGTQLLYSTSSPLSYSLLEGVQGITNSGAQKNDIEYTAISDTSKKFMPDLPDLGELQFDLAWDPSNAGHAALYANFLLNDGTVLYLKRLMDDASAAYTEYVGYVKQFNTSSQKGTFNSASVVFKITGTPNLVP